MEPLAPSYSGVERAAVLMMLVGEEEAAAILQKLEPEEVPFDVVYEDEEIVVVNKPSGIVVHPAPGNWHGTLVHGLLQDVHDLLHVGAVLNLKQNDLVRRAGHGGEAAADLPERNFLQSGEQGTQLRNVRDREQDRRVRAHGGDAALIEHLQIAR